MHSNTNVVLDTNVVYSALVAPDGVCAELVAKLLADQKYSIFYTSVIADEYRDVLHRPKLTCRISTVTIDAMLALLLQRGTEVIAQPISWLVYPDDSDKPFVEAAIYTESTLIASNMKDYPFVGLTTSYPEEFLASM